MRGMRDTPLGIGPPSCELKGCHNDATGVFGVACCDAHRRAILTHYDRVLRAVANGDDPPEMPTAAAVDERVGRAGRWSPEKMQERIDELQEQPSEGWRGEVATLRINGEPVAGRLQSVDISIEVTEPPHHPDDGIRLNDTLPEQQTNDWPPEGEQR